MFNFLDYDQAHEYVESEKKKGRTVWWDGWEIIIWHLDKKGFTRSNGLFVNGRWGTARRIKPNRFGKWRIGVSI